MIAHFGPMAIPVALLILAVFLLVYLGFLIGTTHGRRLERGDQLERLKKQWDELDSSFSEADTLDSPTMPLRFTGYRDHTIN